MWTFQCSWYDYTGLNQQYCWENKKEQCHLLKWAGCVHALWSPSICIFSCGSTQAFLWFKRGLTQVNHPGNVLLLQRHSVPFTLSNTHVPGTKFLPTTSLHNQFMTCNPLWDKNYLSWREMNSFWRYPCPAQINVSLSALGKYLRPSGMV